MGTTADFLFSIVISVQNTEAYISTAIESVLEQSIGFKHVQLILVDDGSTDGSGIICDKYASSHPQNIAVIHQEKRGVSAARNCGMLAATGIYVCFLDSDDKLGRNTLADVYAFFRRYDKEVDVVSVPIIWFDGKTGEHMLNGKFQQGDRVIPLADEPSAIQLSSSSCFIKRSVFDEESLQFDERLMVAEDAKLLQQILLKKQALGVVASGTYYYRRRKTGNHSALQQYTGTPHWYEDHIKYFALDIFRYCQTKLGSVPAFVQTAVLYDLQWRLLELAHKNIPAGMNADAYKKNLIDCLCFIEANVILAQKSISEEIKLYLLRLKYGHSLKFNVVYPNMCFSYDHDVSCVLDYAVSVDFIWIDLDVLHIEGRLSIPPCSNRKKLFALWNGAMIELQLSDSVHYKSPQILNDIIEERSVFCADLSIPKQKTCSLSFACSLEDLLFPVPFGEFGEFCPIGLELKYAFQKVDRFRISANDREIKIERNSFASQIKADILRFQELWRSGKAGREAILFRLCATAVKIMIRKPIWLISDRINTADDNGEAFFRYLSQQKLPIHTRFLLRKNSIDYQRVKRYGTIVEFFSFRHKVDHLICDYLLSSQADHYTANPFGDKWIYYRDYQSTRKFVFLQHGVIKDDLSAWLNRYEKNIYGMVVSSKRERDSVIFGEYGYSAKNLWLTGLPRYDFLHNEGGNLITIMPTWRKELMGSYSETTGVRKLKDGFERSTYYLFYAALLTDKRLRNAAKKYGYQIAFKPHPMMLPYINLFPHCDHTIFLDENISYQKVFADSRLILTDYSSVAFDFAYLRKPVIYCWPDRDDFISGKHVYVPGYFSYEKDGFGEVRCSITETIDQIIEYMENNCQLKPQFRERVNAFFEYNDKNCCQRLADILLSSL